MKSYYVTFFAGLLCYVCASQESDLIKLNCKDISAVNCPIPLFYELRLKQWAQEDISMRKAMRNQRYQSVLLSDSDDSATGTHSARISHEYTKTEKEYYRDHNLIDSIMMEEPCARAGGQCVLASDCPAGLLAETAGLCPNQQPRGVECCYGMSVKETRCFKLGVCMPVSSFCSDKLIFDKAKDCLDDEKCCIMTL